MKWSTRWVVGSGLSLALSLGVAFTGCANPEDAPCELDSDCEGGLLCGPESLCATPETVKAWYAAPPVHDTGTPVVTDTGPPKDSGPPQDISADACQGPSGVFDAGAPCREPTQKKLVTAMLIAPSGHGLARVAQLGNPLIEDAILTGGLKIELWIDGEFNALCGPVLAWIGAPEDRRADCTAVHTDTFPFMLPDLMAADIRDASLDFATGVLTGWVDQQELLDSISPALRDTAASLLDLDLDKNNDGTPDAASVILNLTLQ